MDKRQKNEEMTNLEYGQYALLDAIAASSLSKELTKAGFPAKEAALWLTLSELLAANSTIALAQAERAYQGSWLSKKYPSLLASLESETLTKEISDLSSHATNPVAFMQNRIDASSKKLLLSSVMLQPPASVIGEGWYVFNQVNLFTIRDIESKALLLLETFESEPAQKSSLSDRMQWYTFKNTLFFVDPPFDSKENLRLLSKNGGTYIVQDSLVSPEGKALFASSPLYGNLFTMAKDENTGAMIDYAEQTLQSGERMIIYRDQMEQSRAEFNYQRSISFKVSGYTAKKLEKLKPTWGFEILRTNSKLDAKEIYRLFNEAHHQDSLHPLTLTKVIVGNDYFLAHGVCFLLLLTEIIQQQAEKATKKAKKPISVSDALMLARTLKISLHDGAWQVDNKNPADLKVLADLGLVVPENDSLFQE